MADDFDNYLGDQDPQSAVAAQGLQSGANALYNSQPVQNAVTGQGLQDTYQTAVAAAKGDPQAQQQVAQSSLGTAMGSLKYQDEGYALKAKVIDPVRGGGYKDISLAKPPTIGQRVSVFATKDGDKVGSAHFKVTQDGLVPDDLGGDEVAVHVNEDHRRKGLGTGMYSLATKITGKPIIPAASQTDLGKAMWAQSKRPFADGGPVDEPAGLDQALSAQPQGAPQPMGSDEPAGLDEALGISSPIHHPGDHEGGMEQVKAGLEGAAQGLVGPLAPLAEQAASQLLFNQSPEETSKNILAREHQNPGTHFLGEATGFGLGLFSGTGEAALATKAGELGIKGLGLAGEGGTAYKIGSAAARAAIENMIVGGSDEASKFILNDPNQSAESALTNIGISGLIGGGLGGAIGSVSPLWKATLGKATHGLLGALADRMGGIEGVVPNQIQDALTASGVEMDPTVRAAMSADPEIRGVFQHLQESSSKSGIKAQAALESFKRSASDAVATTLGKTPEDLQQLASSGLSEAEAGNDIKKSLVDSLKAKIDPIASQFEKIKNKYSGYELTDNAKGNIANDISSLAEKEGYLKAPSSPQAKLIQQALKELPLQKTAADITNYISNLGDIGKNPEMSRVVGQLRKVLRTNEDSIITTAAGEKAPEAITEHAMARQEYSKAMDALHDLNDRLHVGRYNGPSSFISSLKEMSPEDILRRLNPKNDSEGVKVLSNISPEALGHLKNFHISQMLKGSAEGDAINLHKFNNSLQKMSPEMKDFIVSGEGQEKIKGIMALVANLPKKMNPSGTAKTLDSLWKHIPGSTIGLAAMLAGHNPVVSAIVGKLAEYLGREAPDAVKLGLLKFLGSNKPIQAEGFKSMVGMINQMTKGESALNKGVKAVIDSSREILPEAAIPTESDNQRLDNKLKKLQLNPQAMINTGGALGTYMPEHQTALGTTAAGAVNFINSQRPGNVQQNPLDMPIAPSKQQKAEYNDVLSMANKPLTVLNMIKQGTITPKKVATFQSLYPSMYKNLQGKLMKEISDAHNEGKLIPYKTRMGLSLFLNQPMDSTMTPASIQAAQPAPPQQLQAQGGSTPQKPLTGPQGTALRKYSNPAQTQEQARQLMHLKP